MGLDVEIDDIIFRAGVTGDTGKGGDVQFRLGQPGGVGLYGFGVFMAPGALGVHVGAGYHLRGTGIVGIVAIRADRLLGMNAGHVLMHHGGVALLAGGP